MAKKDDRRVQRTQQLLRGALLSLIQEKGFEALSVQEIIDCTNVGRATFYAHFANKDDLLMSGVSQGSSTARALARERPRAASARDPRGTGPAPRGVAWDDGGETAEQIIARHNAAFATAGVNLVTTSCHSKS